MVTLTEFLLARIDEVERHARSIVGALTQTDPRYGEPLWEWSGVRSIDGLPSPFRFPTSHPPERVLAECEAKRRIVELPDPDDPSGFTDGWWAAQYAVMQILALLYDSHPDYDEAWRP